MSMIKGLNIIRKWVMSKMMKKSDDGIMVTLPDSKKVDLNTNITADRLLRSGVDIEQLTNTNQVDNLINQINKSEMRVISQDDPRFKGIMNKIMGKKGEVVDMTGKKIKPGSKIMGGKAVDEDLPPPGSRGGPDDIAAPVQSAEESLKDMIEAEATNPRFLDYTIDSMLKMKPIDAMKEANKVIKREGPYKNLSEKEAKKILDDTEDHIFERDFKTPDDPDFDPEDFASGGRVGLKSGSYLFQGLKGLGKRYKGSSLQSLLENPKVMGTEIGYEGLAEILRLIGLKEGGRANFAKGGMTRRAFLKLLGAAGAGVGAAKTGILKLLGSDTGEKAVKEIIKTSDVPGKPKWFDQLVNRVIMEGDDVTKNYATKDREIVHMKKIDDETTVRVTQDLDEDMIMVDVDDPVRNVMGEQGDTSIMLRFKKGKADETTKGKLPDEFDATEADMRNYMDGPDDYTTEFVDNTVTDVKDLTSDLTKIKSYATGKKPTMKELVESKKRREAVKYAEERPAEYAADRGPQYDYGDEDIELYTDYASGGIARMLGE